MLSIEHIAYQITAELEADAVFLQNMAELYEANAFSCGITADAADAMLDEMAAELDQCPLDLAAQDVVDAYKQRADRQETPAKTAAYVARAKKVQFVSCVARDEFSLHGVTNSKNEDGYTVKAVISLAGSSCNCDDSKYNPNAICKHRQALAARWLAH